jgi:Domain of unknown function (DUF4082)
MTDYRIWPATNGAGSMNFGNITIATEFYVTAARCFAKGIWYYRTDTAISATPTGRLYSVTTGTTGTAVAGTDVTFPSSGATGWRFRAFTAPVELTINQRYRAALYFTANIPGGGASFTSDITNGPLTAPSFSNAIGQIQGSYHAGTGLAYPDTGDASHNAYWIDITITPPEQGASALALSATLTPQPAVVAGSTVGAALSAAVGAAERLVASSTVDLSGAVVLGAAGQAELKGSAALTTDAELSADESLIASAAVDLTTSVVFGGFGTVVRPLDTIEFFALNPDGSIRAPLPDVQSYTISPLDNDAGAVSLSYPAVGRNFDILHENVTSDRDLSLSIHINGIPRPQLQAILFESDGDDVQPDSVWKFTGNFIAIRLAEAVVAPKAGMPSQGEDDPEENDAHFYSMTAGAIMRTLLQEVQTRGGLNGITWSSIGNTTDSNGVAWTKIITIKVTPGKTYLEMLKALVEFGMCEFEMYGTDLRMFEFGTGSTDRTETTIPLIFYAGQSILDSPRKHSLRNTATTLLVAGGGGIYAEQSDATALARRGRRIEVFHSQGSIHNEDTLTAYIQARLEGLVSGKMEKTHGFTLGDGPEPIIDFDVGDWGYSDLGSGLEKLRIKQWTLTQDQNGALSGNVTLNDMFAEQQAALARRIQGIEGGTTITGTSQTRPVPEELVDGVSPADPTGIIVDSLAYTSEGIIWAAAFAHWPEVVFNEDGTSMDDLDYYIIHWRYTDQSLWPNPSFPNWATLISEEPEIQWSGLLPGVEIEVMVAARDNIGNYSAYSAPVFHILASDDDAPPVPSTPIATAKLGSVRIEWDGLGSAGEEMPADFTHTEIHISLVNNFTPDTTTYWNHFTGRSATAYAEAAYGTTIFIKLIAVDRSGNKSAPSAQASAVSQRLVSDELIDDIITAPKIADFAVNTAQIVDAAIVSAKIASLAVNNAHINDMSVGKLTFGTLIGDMVLGANIATALTGPRVGMNDQGFYAFDATRQTVDISNTGTATFLGEIRTAETGERIVLNPGSNTPSQMRCYPSDGDLWGGIQVTSYTNPLNTAIKAGVWTAFSGKIGNIEQRGWMELWPAFTRLGVYDHVNARYLSYIENVSQDINLNSAGTISFNLYDPAAPSTFKNKLYLWATPTYGYAPVLSVSASHGLMWGVTDIYVHSGSTNANDYAPIWASAFTVGSARRTKTNIRDLDESKITKFDATPSTVWQYITDVMAGRDRVHIGPMAEDLPQEFVRVAPETGDVGIDLGDKIGIIWEVLRRTRVRLRDQLANINADITALQNAGQSLRQDVNTLQTAGQKLRQDVNILQTEVAALKGGTA